MKDSKMENNNLVEELRRHCRLTKMLQKSLQETRKTFNEIRTANQTITVDISKAEDQAVETVANQPPCIVILSQKTHLAVSIANWIFGSNILPMPVTLPWRSIVFRYGQRNRIGILDDDAGLAKTARSWKLSIPLSDLEIANTSTQSDCRPVDIRFSVPLLHGGARDERGAREDRGVRVAVITSDRLNGIESFNTCTKGVIPIVVYAFQGDRLSDEELNLLHHIHKTDSSLPVYFVRVTNTSPENMLQRDPSQSDLCRNGNSSPQIYRQLREFFSDTPGQLSRPSSDNEQSLTETIVVASESDNNVDNAVIFNMSTTPEKGIDISSSQVMSSVIPSGGVNVELIDFATVKPPVVETPIDTRPSSCDSELSAAVQRAVDRPACDTDTESYAAVVESEIVDGIYDGFSNGLAIFARTVLQNRLLSTVALLHAIHRRCLDLMITTAFDMQWDTICTPTRLKFAREKEDELYRSMLQVALKKQDEIRQIIVDTIASESDTIIQNAGSLDLIATLPNAKAGSAEMTRSVRECMTQIHDFVLSQLNAAISRKLLDLIDVLHESYTGVLTRCLASLEQKDQEGMRSTDTSSALKEILTAAYHVEINVYTGASFVKTLIEKMKQFVHGSLWRTPSNLDEAWKRKTAANVLASLTVARCQRLAKVICSQIRDKVRSSHACFLTSLQRLESHHNGRLKQTEAQSLNVRKLYAPRVARLSLESRSLRDLILYGKPEMGREIGRGQYGVVYACDSWGGCGRCAVKSVAPPDERHWNDLAMEFHYTTNIPEHSRMVSLRGSIIDRFGSGRRDAVLLIMDRYKFDLYTAIEKKISWLKRLQVAVDVVEGIRYLHAQGLVHRDIKLKNVLLDDEYRGKLTDLGFCKPEAMMSGSIVGTPLHMAPELVTGRYDHSVDVYAFGVLFWYVCAGSVRLPSHFEVCANKEMLFTLVQQGLRPERPPDCDDECWHLMKRCWNGNPSQRPHIGVLEDSLRSIFDRFSIGETADGKLVESAVESAESAATDSDGFETVDYDDLTLQ